MIQRIALPVFGTRVSSRLDCSESVLIVSVEAGTVLRRYHMRWAGTSVPERVHRLVEEGVCTLICGGLTSMCAHQLREKNIQVIPWIRGNVEEVLRAFLLGTLHTATDGKYRGRVSV